MVRILPAVATLPRAANGERNTLSRRWTTMCCVYFVAGSMQVSTCDLIKIRSLKRWYHKDQGCKIPNGKFPYSCLCKGATWNQWALYDHTMYFTLSLAIFLCPTSLWPNYLLGTNFNSKVTRMQLRSGQFSKSLNEKYSLISTAIG